MRRLGFSCEIRMLSSGLILAISSYCRHFLDLTNKFSEWTTLERQCNLVWEILKVSPMNSPIHPKHATSSFWTSNPRSRSVDDYRSDDPMSDPSSLSELSCTMYQVLVAMVPWYFWYKPGGLASSLRICEIRSATNLLLRYHDWFLEPPKRI